MKTIQLFFLLLLYNPIYVFAQDTIQLTSYDYEIEHCGKKVLHGGKINELTTKNDTTYLSFTIAYQNCVDFDRPIVMIKNQSLSFDFKGYRENECWCEGDDKYTFTIALYGLSSIPKRYLFVHQQDTLVQFHHDDFVFKEVYPATYIEIDGIPYNYTNTLGEKNGLFLSSSSSLWLYDSVYLYHNDQLIHKKPMRSHPFHIRDSTIHYYQGTRELVKVVTREQGVDITTRISGREHVIEDPRVPKKGHERVIRSIQYSEDGTVHSDCLLYIDKKRMRLKECR